MNLRTLEAVLYRHSRDASGRTTLSPVDRVADAQGIMFLCPKCFEANGGNVGTHSILSWFAGRGVPDDERPTSRRVVTGESIDDISLTPSILIIGCCAWHGFVTRGEAVTV